MQIRDPCGVVFVSMGLGLNLFPAYGHTVLSRHSVTQLIKTQLATRIWIYFWTLLCSVDLHVDSRSLQLYSKS